MYLPILWSWKVQRSLRWTPCSVAAPGRLAESFVAILNNCYQEFKLSSFRISATGTTFTGSQAQMPTATSYFGRYLQVRINCLRLKALNSFLGLTTAFWQDTKRR